MFRLVIGLIVAFMPQRLKKVAYRKIFGFDIHRTAHIGISIVVPRHLIMKEGSQIGHLTMIKGVETVVMGVCSLIGNLNWISGFSLTPKQQIGLAHFSDQLQRKPCLDLGDQAAITNRHLIDCTDTVSIGCFSTLAGFRSQILTHSISIAEARQRSGPVEIGDYTFVGTSSIILPNACLPRFSVLGAGSILNKKYTEEYQLYAGNPARPVKKLNPNAAYFNRKAGYVI